MIPVRQVTRWLSGSTTKLLKDDQQQLTALCARIPELSRAYPIAQSFRNLLLEHNPDQLDAWIQSAFAADVPEMRSFAEGISKDKAAVRSAAALLWSSGQVEGQVNRLKFIKRSMYGRGKLDLLRKRVLYKPPPPNFFIE